MSLCRLWGIADLEWYQAEMFKISLMSRYISTNHILSLLMDNIIYTPTQSIHQHSAKCKQPSGELSCFDQLIVMCSVLGHSSGVSWPSG